MFSYFKELLKTLKEIRTELRHLNRAVIYNPHYGDDEGHIRVKDILR